MRNALAEPLQVRIFSSYLLSLLIPVYSFLFIVTGPHSWFVTVLWILPMWSTVLIDMWSPANRKEPDAQLHPLPYDAILYLLAALQFLAILVLMDFSTRLNFGSPTEWATSLLNLFAIKVIVGTSSSFSGIVVAHELIHRTDRFNQTLGRLLLALECYEHFATEHLRGHHKYFATQADPATARFGESYREFWKRTVPGQFKNAWKLENERLGVQNRIALDSRLCEHRVAQGVLLELMMLAGILFLFGIRGAVVFGVQAFAAVRKLEAVNYIEHWGLCRAPEHTGRPLSWDTDSWFTLNAMVGLSRHSDHHRHVEKPYHQLCYSARSPKLPYGYFATVFLAVSLNHRFQTLARQELDRLAINPARDIESSLGSPGRIHALSGIPSVPGD